jgi:hypothetical protein
VIAWTLLRAGDGLEQPVFEQQPEPFAAVVAGSSFTDIDLRWLATRLALGGCAFGAFHGPGCERARNYFDEACAVAKLALAGEEELRDELAVDWDGELEESPAARWGTLAGVTSTWHEREPLADLFEFLEGWQRAPARGLALALDAASEQAIRVALA